MSREVDRRETSNRASGEERPASRETERSEVSNRASGEERPASREVDRHPLFMPLILVGGAIFGFGLGVSHMARPEVVLDFLQFDDLGLLFVMGGAAVTTGVAFALGTRVFDRAPLTGKPYARRLKSFDRNVLVGGAIFGVGWGVSGICPGAAYASLGIGNVTILWAIAGMFVGAYAQAFARARTADERGASAVGE